MQSVAREMNLSETAFLVKQADGFHLRWFTPVVEVDLCGHATLASAHVLWSESHLLPTEEARFFTRSGWLTAKQQGEWIELDFPAKVAVETPAPPELLEALAIAPLWVGKNQFDYLVEVESEEVLRQIQPNFTQLKSLPVRGVIVTSRSHPPYDFVSRFFAPAAGVDEDPVTGSAHCALAPFWRDRLGKDELLAYQASDRGGVVQVTCKGDRVVLAGQAVTVLRGELLA
jgi:predicted PhzF superfamily epimerase YddE/YHI9